MADQTRGRGGAPSDDVVRALVDSNERMGREMEYLRNRLNALEATGGGDGAARGGGRGDVDGAGGDVASDQAQTEAANNTLAARRGITWRDSMDVLVDGAVAADGGDADVPHKIKFRSSPSNSPNQNQLAVAIPDGKEQLQQIEGDDESSSSDSSEDAVAFSGWARCFFQARHHRSATQIISGATSTTSQDTYLYLTIHSTSNELRISDTDERFRPPLIDPPIPLRYFYAAKVPGSRSGAALFLKNDTRRLRKYIFRFEFVNRAVHQPPARYVQFVRSGKAAKKSMRGINKMKNALNKMGDERRENARENKKRAQDAFAAHLGTLDELLRESDEAAERFVECVNARNEEEEELARNQRELAGSGVAGEGGRSRRTRPPPPYWGSGFNRPSAKDDEDDDEVDSDSDYSEEEDELYDDDDHDDETFFDKVQVSTEQTLETLFHHIVK